MLDDFRNAGAAPQSRRRFGSSLVLSFAVCGAGSFAGIHATRNVQALIDPPPEKPIVLPDSLRPHAEPITVEIHPPAPSANTRHKQPFREPKQVAPVDPPDAPEDLTDVTRDDSAEGSGDAIDVAPAPAPAPPVPPPPPAPIMKPRESGHNRYDRLQYPVGALRRGVEGQVSVRFDVREDGRVDNAVIEWGPPEFHDVVLRAAATWRFMPAMQNGVPVRYRGMVKHVVFRLADASDGR